MIHNIASEIDSVYCLFNRTYLEIALQNLRKLYFYRCLVFNLFECVDN